MKSSAQNYALWLLGKRDYSVGKIKLKLKEKDFSQEEIDHTISYLLDKKFIDDERFAKNFVRSQINIKPIGKYKLKMKLKEKLISDEIVNKVLADISDEDEKNFAKELVRKKYQILNIKYKGDKNKIRERLFQQLLNRGFDYEIVKAVLDNSIY